MRTIGKIGLLSLLAVATLFSQNASATLINLTYLPNSAFAEAVGNWQGYRLYTGEEDDFNVLVEFTLYDTQRPDRDQDEIDLANALATELDMTDQYIYAYQIWNHTFGTFQILDSEGNPINQVLDDIGFYDDGSDGIEPVNTSSAGVWWFAGNALIAGKHSWFLVFNSDFGPVPGTFTIESPSDVPVVPEPAMIVLLGLGSALAMCTRRKKSF